MHHRDIMHYIVNSCIVQCEVLSLIVQCCIKKSLNLHRIQSFVEVPWLIFTIFGIDQCAALVRFCQWLRRLSGSGHVYEYLAVWYHHCQFTVIQEVYINLNLQYEIHEMLKEARKNVLKCNEMLREK